IGVIVASVELPSLRPWTVWSKARTVPEGDHRALPTGVGTICIPDPSMLNILSPALLPAARTPDGTTETNAVSDTPPPVMRTDAAPTPVPVTVAPEMVAGPDKTANVTGSDRTFPYESVTPPRKVTVPCTVTVVSFGATEIPVARPGVAVNLIVS